MDRKTPLEILKEAFPDIKPPESPKRTLPEGSWTDTDRERMRQTARDELSRRRKGRQPLDILVELAQKDLKDADDETLLETADLWPEWSPGQAYLKDNLCTCGDNLYRIVQAHVSQIDWKPDVTLSLYTRVANPAEAWPAWSQPTGGHDAYSLGIKVSHNNKHWVSTTDGNVWEPGIYGWTEEK